MKLRTSFFNGSVLKKDILRFAPVWGLYLIYLLLRLAVNRVTFQPTVVPLLLYAILCAVTLFGDLYNPRRCNALHAMPMRRESWFLTHSIAGFLFFLVPTAIYILLLLLRHPGARSTIIAGFGALILVFFVFYAIALLCVMLAGRRLSAVIMYAVLLSILPIVVWIFQTLYQPFLPGVYIRTETFRQLQLVTRLKESLPTGHFANTLDENGNNITLYTFQADWQYLLTCAGISLLLAGLALLLYRKRKLERAGDFAAFHWVGNCFPPAIGLVFGVLLFQLIGHPNEAYLFLLPYMVIGFLAAKMLQLKKFHVFHWKTLLTLMTLLALIFGSIWIVQTDALGIISYVPKASHVDSVEVYVDEVSTVGGTMRYDASGFTQDAPQVIDTEDIALVTDVHYALLQAPRDHLQRAMVYLTYRLKTGAIIRRYYPLNTATGTFDKLDNAVSTRSAIFGDTDWNAYKDEVYYIRVSRALYGKQDYIFGTPEMTAGEPSNDIKINKDSMRLEFLEALGNSLDDGTLNQLVTPDFSVVIKSRDRFGREKEISCIIPALWSTASDYIEFCHDNGRNCPDRTITEDTVLTVFP